MQLYLLGHLRILAGNFVKYEIQATAETMNEMKKMHCGIKA